MGILCGLFLFLKPVCLEKETEEEALVSIIVPARNEEQNIKKLLESLKGQTYRNFEVIVVDDRSTDTTADAAKALGAKVVRIKDKPPDFLGKPYACYTGFLHSKGEFLIFVDADVRFCNANALSKIVGELKAFDGVISVWPFHEIEQFYENFSSIYAIISSMASRSFSLIAKRVTIRGLYGPLFAVRRTHYIEIGTHKAVKSEIVEDFKLGSIFAEKGISIKNFLGGEDISFRMYPQGLKDLWKGWTKNSALGASLVDWSVVIPILLFLLGSLIPSLFLRTPPFNYLYLFYAGLFLNFIKKVGKFWIVVPVFYPIFVVFTLLIIFYSFYQTLVLGYVEWKGAKIPTKS